MSTLENRDEIVIGVIGRPWGLRGEFHLDAHVDDAAILQAPGALRIRRKGAHAVDCAVKTTHRAGGRLIVSLEGCGSIEEAEALRGSEVLLASSVLEPAPVGSFYPHQLVGLEVIGIGGEFYGRVEELVRSAGPDLLLVRGAGKDHLVPFAEEICRRVDLGRGVVEIDPPPGLMDLG